jgi:hypothetical protein
VVDRFFSGVPQPPPPWRLPPDLLFLQQSRKDLDLTNSRFPFQFLPNSALPLGERLGEVGPSGLPTRNFSQLSTPFEAPEALTLRLTPVSPAALVRKACQVFPDMRRLVFGSLFAGPLGRFSIILCNLAKHMQFRRLIKHSQTGLYYDGHGGWKKTDAEAFAYAATADAITAARGLAPEPLLLVLKFPDSRMDVVTSLAGMKELPPPSSFGQKAPAVIISVLPFAVEIAKHLKQRIN